MERRFYSLILLRRNGVDKKKQKKVVDCRLTMSMKWSNSSESSRKLVFRLKKKKNPVSLHTSIWLRRPVRVQWLPTRLCTCAYPRSARARRCATRSTSSRTSHVGRSPKRDNWAGTERWFWPKNRTWWSLRSRPRDTSTTPERSRY